MRATVIRQETGAHCLYTANAGFSIPTALDHLNTDPNIEPLAYVIHDFSHATKIEVQTKAQIAITQNNHGSRQKNSIAKTAVAIIDDEFKYVLQYHAKQINQEIRISDSSNQAKEWIGTAQPALNGL